MNKNLKIDSLLDEIETLIPQAKSRLKKDGIINEQLFRNQKKKLLFICKEGNDPEMKKGDFRSWWNEEIWGIHALRVGTWAYGILNDFPPIEKISRDDKHKALKSIAFINLKKIGGRSKANYSEILEHVKITREVLLNQIEIIDPDIIIGGISWINMWNEIFGEKELQNKGNEILTWRNKLIIHYYHPSARKSNKELYLGLKEKIESGTQQ